VYTLLLFLLTYSFGVSAHNDMHQDDINYPDRTSLYDYNLPVPDITLGSVAFNVCSGACSRVKENGSFFTSELYKMFLYVGESGAQDYATSLLVAAPIGIGLSALGAPPAAIGVTTFVVSAPLKKRVIKPSVDWLAWRMGLYGLEARLEQWSVGEEDRIGNAQVPYYQLSKEERNNKRVVRLAAIAAVKERNAPLAQALQRFCERNEHVGCMDDFIRQFNAEDIAADEVDNQEMLRAYMALWVHDVLQDSMSHVVGTVIPAPGFGGRFFLPYPEVGYSFTEVEDEEKIKHLNDTLNGGKELLPGSTWHEVTEWGMEIEPVRAAGILLSGRALRMLNEKIDAGYHWYLGNNDYIKQYLHKKEKNNDKVWWDDKELQKINKRFVHENQFDLCVVRALKSMYHKQHEEHIHQEVMEDKGWSLELPDMRVSDFITKEAITNGMVTTLGAAITLHSHGAFSPLEEQVIDYTIEMLDNSDTNIIQNRSREVQRMMGNSEYDPCE